MPDDNKPDDADSPRKGVAKAADPKPPAEEAAPAALGTPLELAIASGNARRYVPPAAFGRAGEQPQPTEELAFTPEHASAAALHGWKEHEHHEGEPMRLSAADYEAALKAASQPVTRVRKDGKLSAPITAEAAAEHAKNREADKGELVTDYEPHDAALSKHSHLARLRAAQGK